MHELIRDLQHALELHRRHFGGLYFLPERAAGSGQQRAAAGSASQTNAETTMNQQMLFQPAETEAADDAPSTPYERIEAHIPEGHPARDAASLEALEALVAELRLIPIDHKRLNPVFGVGNPQADLMLVGEAPGADEDRQGEPFVGRAGMLLNKILAAIGFERDEVYIANILKSRPPNNRTPVADEIEAHIPFLYKQIALIRPKLLLSLGLCSACALLERTASLSSMRGKFHDFHGLPLMVTYHPAALLRNPQWKRPTWEDVQFLRKKYDELAGTPRTERDTNGSNGESA